MIRMGTLIFLLVAVVLTVLGAEPEGATVYQKHCESCHSNLEDRPATWNLRHTRGEAFALIEERPDLAPEYIRVVVRQGFKAMPNFRHIDLSDAELEALVLYLTKK